LKAIEDKEAEEYCLGAVLISPAVLPAILDEVSPEDFYRLSYGVVLQTMIDMEQAKVPIDTVTLISALNASKHKPPLDITWTELIHTLAYVVPASANAPHYARIVKKHSRRRSLLGIGNELVRRAYNEEEDVDEIVNQAEEMIFDLSIKRTVDGFQELSDDLEAHWGKMVERSEADQDITGLKTGFTSLDYKLLGLEPGNLIILAARPSIGKSSLAFCIADNVAIDQGIPVCIATLEMSKHEVINRLLAIESDIPLHKIRLPRHLKEDDWPALTEAIAKLEQSPLFIDDSGILRPFEIRSKLRKLKIRQPNLGLIIVDYLQLMSSDKKGESRNYDISDITRSFKLLSREIKTPILCLSQLSRKVEDRADKRPILSDLRDSGAIEQDADIVLFLYRDDWYNEDSNLLPELNIAKSRNSETGKIHLTWKPRCAKFTDGG
jgi:replicative DNA helicase